jgi:hypothetical protein
MIIKMRKDNNDGLLELIKKIPSNIVMAEIGCYAGESTSLFLNSGKIKTLYAIDPWKIGYDNSDPASNSDMLEVENLFNIRTNICMNNNKGIELLKLKMTLKDAFEMLPELDLIYIDGDHTYNGVLNDILLGKKKVKIGGIISGHDYRKTNPIVVAVNEVLGIPDFIFSDTSWMIKNKI